MRWEATRVKEPWDFDASKPVCHILATYQLYSQNAGELIIVGTAQATQEVEGH